MRAHSAHGLDGFTAAFYQAAPDVFRECLEIVLTFNLLGVNFCRASDSVPSVYCTRNVGMQTLVITGPSRSICVDVKALSKVLSFHLQMYLPKVVYPNKSLCKRLTNVYTFVFYLIFRTLVTRVKY